MKLKMLTGLSGPTYSLSPGEEFEFSDGEAERLISKGFAEPVAPKKVERAVKKPAVETTKANVGD